MNRSLFGKLLHRWFYWLRIIMFFKILIHITRVSQETRDKYSHSQKRYTPTSFGVFNLKHSNEMKINFSFMSTCFSPHWYEWLCGVKSIKINLWPFVLSLKKSKSVSSVDTYNPELKLTSFNSIKFIFKCKISFIRVQNKQTVYWHESRSRAAPRTMVEQNEKKEPKFIKKNIYLN